jgi:hypothetical protein
MVDYDLLLQWASERSEGSLAAFRKAYEWLARTETDMGAAIFAGARASRG